MAGMRLCQLKKNTKGENTVSPSSKEREKMMRICQTDRANNGGRKGNNGSRETCLVADFAWR